MLSLFLAFSNADAQNRPSEGTIGVAASIQGSSTNFSLPIWISEDLVVAPIFGLYHQEGNSTNLNIGVTPRFYRTLGDNFGSYIGARGIINQNSPDNADDTTDFLLGATGGGEYFLDNNFSLSVELQLNLSINDTENNVLSTGSAVTASYYF